MVSVYGFDTTRKTLGHLRPISATIDIVLGPRSSPKAPTSPCSYRANQVRLKDIPWGRRTRLVAEGGIGLEKDP